MAGLLRPAAAKTLVTALRERFDVPVHLHTHDTAGGQLATLLAASEAGVDAVDVATSSMAATTSQPPASALVAALRAPSETPAWAWPSLGHGALLGNRARHLQPLRIRAAGTDRGGSITTRSPVGSSPTCVSRPSPWGWGSGSNRSRRCTAPQTRCWAD